MVPSEQGTRWGNCTRLLHKVLQKESKSCFYFSVNSGCFCSGRTLRLSRCRSRVGHAPAPQKKHRLYIQRENLFVIKLQSFCCLHGLDVVRGPWMPCPPNPNPGSRRLICGSVLGGSAPEPGFTLDAQRALWTTVNSTVSTRVSDAPCPPKKLHSKF